MSLLHAVLLKSVANEFGENSAYKFNACVSHIRSSLVLVLKKTKGTLHTEFVFWLFVIHWLLVVHATVGSCW